MKNPNPANYQTPEEVRAKGLKAESRDADGHLKRTHVAFENDSDIIWFVREALHHGETVTIWPHKIDKPTTLPDLQDCLPEGA